MITRSSPAGWARRGGGVVPCVLAAVALLAGSQASFGQAASGAQGERIVLGSGEDVTFTRDIAPILQENCQACHRPGSIAPMSLLSYEEVRPWAPLIKQRVLERNMPPYHYDPGVGIQELKDDRRLSDEEIATIAQWVDDGTPQGDPGDMPPPVEWPDGNDWRQAADLGPPDHVIPSTPYTLPASGPDIWWRPMVEVGLTEDRCIKAIEVKPSEGGRAVVHHAIPTIRVQDEEGNWDRLQGGTLTEFALGKVGELIPDGACRMVPAEAMVSWEIHYSPQGEVVEDDVIEVGLWFYPKGHEPEYRQTLRNYPLERQGPGPVLDLAPHGTAMTQGFYSWDHPVRLDSFMPHGHYRLRAKWLEIYHPSTGEREIVSMVSNFNPNWQNSYTYADHVAPLVPTGSVVILTAFHDNTANNPFNPDPDQWVMRGARTTDEMSHAWLAVTHLDEEGYEQLVAQREASQRVAQQPDRE